LDKPGTSGITTMVWQLLLLQKQQRPRPPSYYNPRPAGMILPGSTTELVLCELRARYPVWQSRSQIACSVGKNRGAVQWALLYLMQQKLIKAVPDVNRNPRYLRYQAIVKYAERKELSSKNP